MPTGYTFKIGEGQSFKEFAFGCAKAFGALVSLRDEPDAEIPDEIKPDDYYLKNLQETKKLLKKFEQMDIMEVMKLLSEEFYQETKDRDKKAKESRELLKKYEKMKNEIVNWIPPTSDHVQLKEFMLEQINISIEHDCAIVDVPSPVLNAETWLRNRKKELIIDIEYYEAQYAEEVKRCKKRTEWVQSLIKSLPKE